MTLTKADLPPGTRVVWICDEWPEWVGMTGTVNNYPTHDDMVSVDWDDRGDNDTPSAGAWLIWRIALADESESLDDDGADLVNHPPHYTAGGIETIDFIEAKGLNYHLGNAVKYIARVDLKGNPVQDLEKAKWYIEREITRRKIEEYVSA